MNTSTWIVVAQIALPSLIALLIGYWQIRVMRSLANPTNTSRPFRETRIGKLVQKIKPFTLPILGFLSLLYSLIKELISSEPVTRASVFLIAFDISMLILYGVGSLIMLFFYLEVKKERNKAL